MISSKKIFIMERNFQNIAGNSHKNIYLPVIKKGGREDKGHCVVYIPDQRRCVIPLDYLNKTLFREVLRMAEEEYGLPTHHPITLPCDAVFMNNVISLVRKDALNDLEKALPTSMHSDQCSSSLSLQQEKDNSHNPAMSF